MGEDLIILYIKNKIFCYKTKETFLKARMQKPNDYIYSAQKTKIDENDS